MKDINPQIQEAKLTPRHSMENCRMAEGSSKGLLFRPKTDLASTEDSRIIFPKSWKKICPLKIVHPSKKLCMSEDEKQYVQTNKIGENLPAKNSNKWSSKLCF